MVRNQKSQIDAFFGQPDVLDKLNEMNCCAVITLDRKQLFHELDRDLTEAGLTQPLANSHPHLFSDTPVFVSRRHVAQMQAIIQAVHRVAETPAYQRAVSRWAPEVYNFKPNPKGVFFGYDFHLGADGPKLIEINTNAGGALFNAYLARAQIACCQAVQRSVAGIADPTHIEDCFMEMFRREWALQHPGKDLKTIAIVDDDPMAQGMFPEFALYRKMFERHGFQAIICDPASLTWANEKLLYKGLRINMVYNRHCDFYLQEAASEPLRQAYLNQAAVITPHPRAYALYADKRNLTLLSQASWLEKYVDPELCQTLTTGIPQTEQVVPENAEAFWADRKTKFFKPVTGFGSRAVYRGSKLTKNVWTHIAEGGYVAQDLTPPGERHIMFGDQPQVLKVDLRAYVYDGRLQFLAARLYRGQTTNMKTPGGGFSPVFTEAEGA